MGWFFKDKKEKEEVFLTKNVEREFELFSKTFQTKLRKVSSLKVLSIGTPKFSNSGCCQVWYTFIDWASSPDIYPISEYLDRVLNKIEPNSLTFKILVTGSDEDGDYLSMEKRFEKKDAVRAIMYLEKVIKKERTDCVIQCPEIQQ